MVNLVLNITNDDYSKKVLQENTQQKVLLNLAWKVMDFSHLSEASRTLLVDLSTVIELIQDESTVLVAVNIPHKLSRISENLTLFLRGKYIN